MDRSSRVEILPNVMLRMVGDECILLDVDTEKYFGLDDVGTDLITAFRDGADVGAAVDLIVASYDVDVETVLADARELVATLVARGLVQVS